MAGLCGGQGNLDRLMIPHLTHQDNIGILSQRPFKALANESVSNPTSRWLMMLFLSR